VTANGKPRIHLWIFNHPYHGISDQVDFFTASFRQAGYVVSVDRKPRNDALNVSIENFSVSTRDTLIDFCTKSRQRVAVIMTEHIDFDRGEIFVHGHPFWSHNDYMDPAVQVERLRCLMDCAPYVRCLMVLGDLPELRSMSELLPGMNVQTIPFPRLPHLPHSDVSHRPQPDYDTLFTGVITQYRRALLKKIRNEGISTYCPEKFVSVEQRDEMNRNARVVLNIPQRMGWNWLSLMRIIAALRCGRATVSLGTSDMSKIAACTYQLNMEDADWLRSLESLVGDWQGIYNEAHDNYCAMISQFELAYPFPHEFLETWAIADNV